MTAPMPVDDASEAAVAVVAGRFPFIRPSDASRVGEACVDALTGAGRTLSPPGEDAALRQEVEGLKTENARLREAINAAAFHYFHCGADDGCGKVASSLAAAAVLAGFDRGSVLGDEIRAACASTPTTTEPRS